MLCGRLRWLRAPVFKHMLIRCFNYYIPYNSYIVSGSLKACQHVPVCKAIVEFAEVHRWIYYIASFVFFIVSHGTRVPNNERSLFTTRLL